METVFSHFNGSRVVCLKAFLGVMIKARSAGGPYAVIIISWPAGVRTKDSFIEKKFTLVTREDFFVVIFDTDTVLSKFLWVSHTMYLFLRLDVLEYSDIP